MLFIHGFYWWMAMEQVTRVIDNYTYIHCMDLSDLYTSEADLGGGGFWGKVGCLYRESLNRDRSGPTDCLRGGPLRTYEKFWICHCTWYKKNLSY